MLPKNSSKKQKSQHLEPNTKNPIPKIKSLSYPSCQTHRIFYLCSPILTEIEIKKYNV